MEPRPLAVDAFMRLNHNRNPHWGQGREHEMWPVKPRRKPRYYPDWETSVVTTIRKLSADEYFGERENNLAFAYNVLRPGMHETENGHQDWVRRNGNCVVGSGPRSLKRQAVR